MKLFLHITLRLYILNNIQCTISFRLGTAAAKIRRSRSESHSDAYDADDGEELFIPRHVKNGIFVNN